MINETGWKPFNNCVLVKVQEIKEKTVGGIYIPDSSREKMQYAKDSGTIVDIGEGAFSGVENPPKIGDEVMYSKYDGQVFDDSKHRFIVDADIIAFKQNNGGTNG